ncbi:MAG TPA: LpqB family beta-propeller domain-containing protein [Jatrophihabitantaceae bacterium]|jgi:hypothetical protein|nr:LpqB family beta-propeller domain-containing protein [Jatrophihabitantaceae bacterium]
MKPARGTSSGRRVGFGRRIAFRRWLGVVAVLAGVAALAGCSGIPSSSAPQIIRAVTGGVVPSAEPTIAPAPNSDPREIVTDFLSANLGDDAHHVAARGFLTEDARSKWTDTTVTVVGTFQVSVADPITHQVTVTADQLGTLDQSGIYTPVLEDDGETGIPITLTFGMQQVSGQWRISQLANGLVVDRADFKSAYEPRPIYFFDDSQPRLVPDLRYSALTDQSLCTWLLQQLSDPPSAELQSAVTGNLPAQTNHASVTFSSSVITVDLPGVSQLNGQTRVHLAAQIAYTFQIDFNTTVELTDGSHAVDIPRVPSPFTASDFVNFAGNGLPPTLYYLHAGALVESGSAPVPGPAGQGSYHLTSVAVAQRGAGPGLVAATTGPSGEARLLTGPLGGSLTLAKAPAGPLTRPAWAPGLSEAWIGDGALLLRVSASGQSVNQVAMAGRSSAPLGRIESVAFSPDGARIALVMVPGDGTAQVWVGAVVRTGSSVRVDGLEPVTPPGLVLVDVAWNDSTTLYTIGADATRGNQFGFWAVQVDGSLLNPRSTDGLPGSADTITTTSLAEPWASATGAVFVLKQNLWSSPAPGGQTTGGTAPNYLE